MKNLIKPTDKIIELFFVAWSSTSDTEKKKWVKEIMTELEIESKYSEYIYSIMKKSGNDDYKIKEVFEKYGNNSEDDVLYKVLILDKLYSTQIVDPISIAGGILSIENIDNRLKDGDLSLVEEIEKCGNKRDEYSFATKYCSWSSGKYVMYDKIVGSLLWSYNKQYNFCNKFSLNSLRKYKNFFNIYHKFIRFCYPNKSNDDYKKIDIFLWSYGKILDKEKRNSNNISPKHPITYDILLS